MVEIRNPLLHNLLAGHRRVSSLGERIRPAERSPSFRVSTAALVQLAPLTVDCVDDCADLRPNPMKANAGEVPKRPWIDREATTLVQLRAFSAQLECDF